MLGQARQWRSTLVYGLAHFGKSLFWYSSEILFAFFLTELVGLSAAQMGAVLAIGFLVSAAIDVTMGRGLERWLAVPATAGRVQMVGALLSSIALALVFMGAWVSADLRYGYAILAGIGFRLAFAVYDIPQNALMALATADEASRLRVASTRIWFSGAATLTVAGVVGPMIASGGTGEGATLLFGLALAFALVAIATATMLARLLPGVGGEPARGPASLPRGQASSLRRWRPPSTFWLLIGVSLVTTIFTPAFSKLEPYFASYALRSGWWGGAIIVVMALGIVIGQPLWLYLCARMPGARVMIGAALIQIVSLACFWLAGAQWPVIAAVGALGFGLGNGGVGMVQWAAFSETVARHASGRTGIAYGLFVASNKIGLAIGGVVIAGALDVNGVRDPGGNVLAMLMALIPGCGAVLLIANGLALLAADRSKAPEKIEIV